MSQEMNECKSVLERVAWLCAVMRCGLVGCQRSLILFLARWLVCFPRGDAVLVGRLSLDFDLVRNVTHEDSLCYQSKRQLPLVTLYWPFYSRVWDRNRHRKTLGEKFMIDWKSTFLIVNLVFQPKAAWSLHAQRCFIHCAGNYCRVNIRLMLAFYNQICVYWILLRSVLTCFAGEWVDWLVNLWIRRDFDSCCKTNSKWTCRLGALPPKLKSFRLEPFT